MKEATLEYWAAPHDSLKGPHADNAPERERERAGRNSGERNEWEEKNGRSTEDMKNNGWWSGIRPTRWVFLNQKQHVTQAQAHQRARSWPCVRSWAEKGHIHSPESIGSSLVFEKMLSYVKPSSSWHLSFHPHHTSKIHFFKFSSTCLSYIISSIHPSLSLSLSMNTAQWVRDATCPGQWLFVTE